MHLLHSKKNPPPIWWSCLLLLLSALYLIPEIIFNSQLVAIAGGKWSSEETLKQIELFGRAVSGIGITLLLADLILRGRLIKTPTKAALSFFVLLVFVWPIIFFGQKWAIDEFIINKSTPEQRYNAYLAQMVRKSLSSNALDIEGIPYNASHVATGEEMTFLTILGGIIYSNQQVLNSINADKNDIASKLVEASAVGNFEENYANYSILKKDIKNSYKNYQKQSGKYNQEMNGSPETAANYWNKVDDEIKDGWEKYQESVKRFSKKSYQAAKKIQPKLERYETQKIKCRDSSNENKCNERLAQEYKQGIKQLGLDYVSPGFWGNCRKTFLISFCGRPNYSLDRLTERVMVLNKGKFSKGSGGYSHSISNFETFKNHPTTALNTRRHLQKKYQLDLPEDWGITDRVTFIRAAKKQVKKNVNDGWRKESNKMGMNMPPNLSWNAFQRHASIQSKIKKNIGSAFYIKPMMASWNNKQFQEYVIHPGIKKETKQILRILNAGSDAMAEGGKYEKQGESALRATVIPPISMALSLFLIIVTMVKLPSKAITILKGKFQIPLPVSLPFSIPEKINFLISPIVSIATLILIFAIPLISFSNKYTEEQSTVNYFLSNMEKNVSSSLSKAIRWTIVTQPYFQGIGLNIEEEFKLYNAFIPWHDYLNKADKIVLPLLNSSCHAGLCPLYIHTNINDSVKISVMNIEPIYEPGMKLPPGIYKIKVEAADYKTQNKNINLTLNKQDFHFNL